MKKKRRLSLIIACLMSVVFAFLLVCMITEASTRTGWVGDRYIHETKSQMYDKGEPCRNTYRWRGNKLYYFKGDGRVLRKSTKYIKLNRDHSVHYIYTPGTNHNDRYNARLRRCQKRTRKGHWKEYGMQTNIWWMCDWQP